MDNHMTWQGAQQFCKNFHVPQSGCQGLASVADNQTNMFLASLANKRALIGGFLKDGKWSWIDGTPFEFQTWNKGQPSGGENFLEMSWRTGLWNDVPDDYPNKHGFFCQYGI